MFCPATLVGANNCVTNFTFLDVSKEGFKAASQPTIDVGDEDLIFRVKIGPGRYSDVTARVKWRKHDVYGFYISSTRGKSWDQLVEHLSGIVCRDEHRASEKRETDADTTTYLHAV